LSFCLKERLILNPKNEIASKKVVIVRLGQTQDRNNWDIGYFTGLSKLIFF